MSIDELKEALKTACPDDVSPEKWRGAILKTFKKALKTRHSEIQRDFEENNISGYDVIAANSELIDDLIQAMLFIATEYVGGYGRREMAPYSDIDLLFILPTKNSENYHSTIEFVLYLLWDMGLKVGQAVRSVDECIDSSIKDMTIRTNMLEARYIWGSKSIYDEFQSRYEATITPDAMQDFVKAKLDERDIRHNRTGQSRYVLEPDIKECRGGLRDLHMLFWLAKYLFGITEMHDLK